MYSVPDFSLNILLRLYHQGIPSDVGLYGVMCVFFTPNIITSTHICVQGLHHTMFQNVILKETLWWPSHQGQLTG